jgi:hypothetical protein
MGLFILYVFSPEDFHWWALLKSLPQHHKYPLYKSTYARTFRKFVAFNRNIIIFGTVQIRQNNRAKFFIFIGNRSRPFCMLDQWLQKTGYNNTINDSYNVCLSVRYLPPMWQSLNKKSDNLECNINAWPGDRKCDML